MKTPSYSTPLPRPPSLLPSLSAPSFSPSFPPPLLPPSLPPSIFPPLSPPLPKTPSANAPSPSPSPSPISTRLRRRGDRSIGHWPRSTMRGHEIDVWWEMGIGWTCKLDVQKASGARLEYYFLRRRPSAEAVQKRSQSHGRGPGLQNREVRNAPAEPYSP